MNTMIAHAEAERIWHLNFSDRPTEEFARLRDIVEDGQRRDEFRLMLGEKYQYLLCHVAALSDQWLPLTALYGDANSGVKHGEYDTLVWLGIAEHKTQDIFSPGARSDGPTFAGSRSFYRLRQPVEMVKLWCGHEVPAGTGIPEGLCDECSALLVIADAKREEPRLEGTEAYRDMDQAHHGRRGRDRRSRAVRRRVERLLRRQRGGVDMDEPPGERRRLLRLSLGALGLRIGG